MDGTELHGEQVLLGRCAADDEADVIGRAGCRAEALHLLHEERDERALVLNGGLGHGVEVGLVGRTAAFGYHDEAVLVALCGLDVYLRGQVAARVDLVVHRQGRVLRVAEVVRGKGVVDAVAQGLCVVEVSPHPLALLAVDDGRAGVLAEGEHTLGRGLGVAQQGERYIFVIVRCFRVGEDGGHLLVVTAAQEELHIVECLGGQHTQGLAAHLEYLFALKHRGAYALARQQAILCLVLARLEHRGVIKFGNICHSAM